VDIRELSSEAGSCGKMIMKIRSTKEYNGVSLRKEDLMCAIVTVRLL
jgi:hypothetical protein